VLSGRGQVLLLLRGGGRYRCELRLELQELLLQMLELLKPRCAWITGAAWRLVLLLVLLL